MAAMLTFSQHQLPRRQTPWHYSHQWSASWTALWSPRIFAAESNCCRRRHRMNIHLHYKENFNSERAVSHKYPLPSFLTSEILRCLFLLNDNGLSSWKHAAARPHPCRQLPLGKGAHSHRNDHILSCGLLMSHWERSVELAVKLNTVIVFLLFAKCTPPDTTTKCARQL